MCSVEQWQTEKAYQIEDKMFCRDEGLRPTECGVEKPLAANVQESCFFLVRWWEEDKNAAGRKKQLPAADHFFRVQVLEGIAQTNSTAPFFVDGGAFGPLHVDPCVNGVCQADVATNAVFDPGVVAVQLVGVEHSVILT